MQLLDVVCIVVSAGPPDVQEASKPLVMFGIALQIESCGKTEQFSYVRTKRLRYRRERDGSLAVVLDVVQKVVYQVESVQSLAFR